MTNSYDWKYLILLGKRIAEIRKKKGLTQDELCAKIGADWDKSNLSITENGRRNITVTTLRKIAKGLEVPMSDFFKGLD